MKNIALSLLLLSQVAIAGPTIRVSEVRALSSIGSTLVILTARTAYTAEVAEISFTPEALELTGSFTSSTVLGSGPTMLCTTYEDARGLSHGVTTDCGRLSDDECAARHKAALDAMLKIFPPAKH